MADSTSSLLDLLFPQHEFKEAKRKFPENFLQNTFSMCSFSWSKKF